MSTACASPKKPILRHRSPAELRSNRDWVSRGLRRKGRLVTFADALGLELEHVRRLVHHQQVPLLLPPSATKVLPRLAKTSALVADFKLPDASKLAELVQKNKVSGQHQMALGRCTLSLRRIEPHPFAISQKVVASF